MEKRNRIVGFFCFFFLIFDRFLNTYKNGIYRLVLFFFAAMLDSSIFHDVCVQFFF